MNTANAGIIRPPMGFFYIIVLRKLFTCSRLFLNYSMIFYARLRNEKLNNSTSWQILFVENILTQINSDNQVRPVNLYRLLIWLWCIHVCISCNPVTVYAHSNRHWELQCIFLIDWWILDFLFEKWYAHLSDQRNIS